MVVAGATLPWGMRPIRAYSHLRDRQLSMADARSSGYAWGRMRPLLQRSRLPAYFNVARLCVGGCDLYVHLSERATALMAHARPPASTCGLGPLELVQYGSPAVIDLHLGLVAVNQSVCTC